MIRIFTILLSTVLKQLQKTDPTFMSFEILSIVNPIGLMKTLPGTNDPCIG